MPRYTVNLRGFGWFDIDAEDAEDAANVADELTRNGVPVGAEWDDCEVGDIIEQDD